MIFGIIQDLNEILSRRLYQKDANKGLSLIEYD